MDSNKVEILGRHYNIAGIQDRDYLEKLARIVDGQMRKIMEATGTVDTSKVAILAALNIADCYYKDARERKQTDKELERNISALTRQIRLALSS